ncbi:hypothetical protein [Synechococcus sp. CCY 9618]|uniref:hypothetical protein n=1 Tax=Synechococcus sp. CCY 9618 TaxID=2815602 RepID=UPI001C216AAA|nr:hypothetical protein [Synechococcus sp. CCY 9618]
MPYPFSAGGFPTPGHSPLPPEATLHPGSFVQLACRQGASYQVISIDDETDSCWVRRWPLTRHGSPAFSVSQRDVRPLQETIL